MSLRLSYTLLSPFYDLVAGPARFLGGDYWLSDYSFYILWFSDSVLLDSLVATDLLPDLVACSCQFL
jgi:hypothetical protein